MKKKATPWLLASLLVAALCLPAVSACGDDEENLQSTPSGSDGGGEEDPGSSPVAPSLTVTEQKQKLQATGLDLTGKVSANHFSYYADLAEHVEYTLCERYDCSAVENWFDDCLKSITTLVSRNEETTDYGYGYVTTYSKRLYAASAFTGHFVLTDGKWTRTPADDLMFSFPDQTGAACVVRLTTGGASKTVYAGDSEDYDYVWDYETGTGSSYEDIYENRFAVPENVTLTLTQNGATKVAVTVTTDLSSMGGEEFDLARDAYSVTADVRIDGYEWNVARLAYRANGQAAITTTMKKDGEMLVSASLTADNALIDTDEETASAKAARVDIDIMGKVQMKGTVQDVKAFADYLEKADDCDGNEADFKSWINQANNLLGVGVYYDGTATRQAGVKMAAFSESDYWSGEWWYAEPVIYFDADGSSVSTFETFFDRDSFKQLSDKFEQLMRDFSDLLGD